MGKDNFHHLFIPTREHVHVPGTCINLRMLPTVHHREVRYVQENPHYYTLGIFY